MEPQDIYTELLGVAPGPRPPNHYDILGLPLFEADAQIVHEAVLRQSAELKRWALDPRLGRMDAVQKMLNEVSQAGYILQDPKYRGEYERELAVRLGISLPARTPAVRQAPAPERPVAQEPPLAFPRPMAEPVPAEAVPRRRPRVPPPEEEAVDEAEAPRGYLRAVALMAGSILASVALLALGFLLGRAWAPTSGDGGPKETAQAVEKRLAAAQQARAQVETEAKRLTVELAGRDAELVRLRATLRAAQARAIQPPESPAPKQAKIVPPPTPTPVPTRVAWPFSQAEAKRRQEETARALGVTAQKEVDIGGGVRLAIVLIPPGEFDMGSPAGEDGRSDNERLHRVTIAEPFWIGQYEVTQEQWRAVTGGNPSRFQGDKNPVENVSWNDCQDFLRRLNARGGKGRFALPTEAQWEWACRAGSSARFSFGDRDGDLGEYAWYSANSGNTTHPVGKKIPNAWGLYDMHGNVWQWLASLYWDGYDGGETRGADAVVGVRVLRGGSWNDDPRKLRSADRYWSDPSYRSVGNGFRVVWRSQE